MSATTGRQVVCPCGAQFYAARWQLNAGRGKYCSNACKWKYKPWNRTTYTCESNPTWVKKGEKLSPATQFKAGVEPWNKGKKFTPNPPHPGAGYHSIHNWVRYHKGSAKKQTCGCGSPAQHWANLSHEYHRDLDDYQAMCISCHNEYDKGHRGASFLVRRSH